MVELITACLDPAIMAPINSDGGGKRIKAVQRAFEVVETLRGAGEMKIADVAEALDLPVSTAHVHLKTLESVGYVVKGDEGYRLGLRFLRDGISVRECQHVYRVCRPEIDELAENTREVANLGVEEEGMRVILYQAEGSDAVYDNAPIGEYTRMHCTALGKMILSTRSVEHVDSVIERYGLPAETDETLTDRDTLLSELERIDERGFAVEDEERRAGIRSIAVPIEIDDALVGAISLSGPKNRFSDARIEEELLPELRDTKNVVEVKYAYQ